ncbi:MAG: carboxypeptidase-like regulatory domain-containing protein, partial [Actinomycetota bacterium]
MVVVLAASCSGSTDPEEPTAAPSTTVPPIEAPAQLPDTRDVALAAAVGTPVPAEAPTVRGGDADLVGTVEGPDGPVPGAEVLLERFVGDQRASLVVRTDRDGRYRALNVFGGRYRIRAWKSPELALTQPVLEFFRDDEETVTDLRLTRHEGLTVQAVVDRSSALVGDAATITALVTDETVDERGIVVAPAAVGEAVDLDVRGPWALDGGAGAVTDGDGRVTWTVTCEQPGSGVFTV